MWSCGKPAKSGALLVALAAAALRPANPQSRATFAEHVAPILHRQCASCHYSGGSAPFSLLTYAEVRDRAALIAAAVESRRMPPWLPEPGYAEFAGERRLSDPEIATIRQWVNGGTQQGNPGALPPPPRFHDGWQLGEPDLVIEFPAYAVAPGAGDVYRNLVVRYPMADVRYVSAVEIRPGDHQVVHHARLMVDTTRSSRAYDERDAGPGFDGMDLASDAVNPDGFFVGWTPGKVPRAGEPDMAWRISPGTDFVLQVHLRPGSERRQVAPRLGLHFADRAPARQPALIMLGSKLIDIPPGESRYVVTDSFTLPVDVEMLGVYPHAHYLATRMEGYARMPDGKTRWLIRIADWDFNWQDEYRYERPIPLPAGATLIMRYTYDNSAGNPQNPSRPPRRVRYGPNSADEMADLVVQVLPGDPKDLAALRSEIAWRMHADESVFLAVREGQRGDSLLARGDVDGAIAHYREAVLLQSDATTHAALGTALALKGDTAQAIAQLERALRLAGEERESELTARIQSMLERFRKR